MPTATQEIIALEQRFWQSMVDEDTDTALTMLSEPSMMVSPHGAMQFDHAAYRKMAEQGAMVIKSFKLSDMNVMFPNDDTAVLTYKATQVLTERGRSQETKQDMTDASVWSRQHGGAWRCVMHTETPVSSEAH